MRTPGSDVAGVDPHSVDEVGDVGVVDVVSAQGVVECDQVVDVLAEVAGGGGDDRGDGGDGGVALVGRATACFRSKTMRIVSGSNWPMRIWRT